MGKHRRQGRHRASGFASAPSASTPRRTATTVALGALSLGAVIPTALASTDVAGVVKAFVDSKVVYEATQADNTRDLFTGAPSGTIMVVTPGTDDGTLIARNLPLVGNRQTLIVNYPQSFGPVIAGQSGKLSVIAPSYDDSKATAIQQNVSLMDAFAELGIDGPFVIYTGYSQGADALGDAAEEAYAGGLLDPATARIVLVSDPRSPWGIKAWLASMPVLPTMAGFLGIESNGPRDPRATGDLDVTSIIIVGDPVSNFQWVWWRPVTSVAVNLAGFVTIHSGTGSQTFGDLDELGDPTFLTSGNTTYAVYDAAHPFALLLQVIHDELGIPYSDDDVDRWDRLAEAYFETQAPSPDTAAPGISVVADEPAPSSSEGYEVTVPAAVATGAETASPSAPSSPEPGVGQPVGPETATGPATDVPATSSAPTSSTPMPSAPTPSSPTNDVDDSATQHDSDSDSTGEIPAAPAPESTPEDASTGGDANGGTDQEG